jgi:DNA polymerase III sliding clamp (beta) subunit (PCNA family)
MLKELKFVQGAVSTKDLVVEMKHVVIHNRHIRAFNGLLTLSSPIDLDISCAPKAAPLLKAIDGCTDAVTLALTEAGKLRITSGGFRAFIECVDMEAVPHPVPTGRQVALNGELLMDAFRKLHHFGGDDASRPWTNGILLRGQSAFATNNVCLVEYWLGTQFPVSLNIPMPAIKEMMRIGEAPTGATVDENSATFYYEGSRWLKTQLYNTDWPDLSSILDVQAAPSAIPEGLFEALDSLKPFLEDRGYVYFTDGHVSTHESLEHGACFTVPGVPEGHVFSHKMLNLLRHVATSMDMTTYPKPMRFFGERLRGAIVGVKL